DTVAVNTPFCRYIYNVDYFPVPKEGNGYCLLNLIDTLLDTRTWYKRLQNSSDCSYSYTKQVNNRIRGTGRSFAEVQLISPLSANEEYVVEFYTLHKSQPAVYYTNNIGALVTQDTFQYFDYFVMNITPTVEAAGIIYEEHNWVRVKGSFLA